jgi:polysaccharide biosynthesis transport protein
MKDSDAGGKAPRRHPLGTGRGSSVERFDGAPGWRGSGDVPGDGYELGPGRGARIDLDLCGRILRQQWWVILMAFLVVTAGVTVGTLSARQTFRATATLEIRPPAVEVRQAESLIQADRIPEQYLQTQFALLRGRVVAQRALSDRELVARLAPDHPDALTLDQRPSATLIARVQKRITVDPVAGTRLVRVSYDAEDPDVAAQAVNALVHAYVALRAETGLATIRRLEEQADSVRVGVLAAERDLQQFVRANRLGSVITGGQQTETTLHERLRHLQQELTAVEAESYGAEAASSVAAAGSLAMPDSELLRTLRARIADLQGEHARMRSTFTDSFPRTRQVRSELAQLESLRDAEEQRMVRMLRDREQATLRHRALLQAAVTEQRAVLDNLAGRLGEYERLRRDLAAQEELFALLQQKQKEGHLSAALATMEVLDPATPPIKPIRPQPRRDIPLGALAGLFLGIGLAFVRHLADNAVRTSGDVQAVADVRLLGVIPAAHVSLHHRRLTPGRPNTWHRIDRADPSDATLDEAFSGIRTSLLYSRPGTERGTFMVTSSRPGEGKTTVSANLAISLARLGRRVLLIDADTRRPSLHRVFGLPFGDAGLCEALTGPGGWCDVVRRDVAPRLDVITANHNLENPADALSGPKLHRLLSEAKLAYDFVLLDAPAIDINEPDARILAHVVDRVILVVRSGKSDRSVVHQVLAQLDNLEGVVLNDIDLRYMPGYYHKYDRPAPPTPGLQRFPPPFRDTDHHPSTQHEFLGTTCIRCGCSMAAVQTFKWSCSIPHATALPAARPAAAAPVLDVRGNRS